MDWLKQKVGQIVVNYPSAVELFRRSNIDFYCQGGETLAGALTAQSIDRDSFILALEAEILRPAAMPDFQKWSLELQVDYVIKYHHHNIRHKGPQLLALVESVTQKEAANTPSLRAVYELFRESLDDLLQHLHKEDQILYPAIYRLARREHTEMESCFPSIAMPIKVMMQEHEIEAEIFKQITQLTDHYQAPQEADSDYQMMLQSLASFERDLQEHIHLENNLIFPKAIEVEKSFPLL